MKDLSNTIIETERLILKPISLEYAEEMFREFDEEVTHYMYPKQMLTGKTWDMLEYNIYKR